MANMESAGAGAQRSGETPFRAPCANRVRRTASFRDIQGAASGRTGCLQHDEQMADQIQLNDPWLVATWPGMGNVGVSAGVYLMAKLGMHQVAEFSPRGVFDMDHVDVKNGIIRSGRLPRSRFFAWRNGSNRHDVVVFIGEAQPPTGTDAFCRKLIDYAGELVKRVFTFAAMATGMRHRDPSRVFGAVLDQESLGELKGLDLNILDDAQISGLNGVLLGVAAEAGMRGACLLGEMPQIFSQLPYRKASRAILGVFSRMAGIDLDLTELDRQTRAVEQKLGGLITNVEQAMESSQREEDPLGLKDLPAESEVENPKPKPTSQDRDHIETLFEEAKHDRSKAFELKHELDRLHLFKEYEDRFLDLFQEPG